MKIRHLVIINFQKSHEKDFQALLESTRPYINEIPGIISYDIFPNDSKYVREDTISFGVEIIFEDKNALDVFMEHPSHFKANELFEKYLSNPQYMVLTHNAELKDKI